MTPIASPATSCGAHYERDVPRAAAARSIRAGRFPGYRQKVKRAMIQLPKNVKPEEVCSLPVSRVATRYGTDNPWYDQEAKAVCATDGRIAVLIPVDSAADDVTGELPREALKAFRKATPRGVDDLLIVAENGTVSCQGIIMAREAIERHRPDVRGIIPKRKKPDEPGQRKAATVTVIGIDVKLLAKLGKAMGTDLVRLQITDPEPPARRYCSRRRAP